MGFSRPRGPRASPPIQCCSLHYPLYLSICPSVHHCLFPAAHLATLLASLLHTASIAALLWVTFKDQALLLINTETAALYSMSVLFSPSSSLPLSLSKSKVLHLLMLEAVSSHLHYIQTKDKMLFATFPLSSVTFVPDCNTLITPLVLSRCMCLCEICFGLSLSMWASFHLYSRIVS